MPKVSKSHYRKVLRDLEAGGFSPAQIMGLMKVFENYMEPLHDRLEHLVDAFQRLEHAVTAARPPARRARIGPPRRAPAAPKTTAARRAATRSRPG